MEEGQEWALEIAMGEGGHGWARQHHDAASYPTAPLEHDMGESDEMHAVPSGVWRLDERRRGRAMTPTRPFRAPLIALHRPDDRELWPTQASIDEPFLRAEEESEVPAKKILPSDTLVYNDEWGFITKCTMMLAGLMLDVSAVMSALVAVIVQCFTFGRRLCGRP